MKKIILLLLVLFGTYESFCQPPPPILYSYVGVSFGEMDAPCKGDINVCLEVCWSPSGNCLTGGDIVCNLWCANFKEGHGQYLGSYLTPILNICSNKLVITTPTCYFEFPINNLVVGTSYVFNNCECCYKITYIGENDPSHTQFRITKCN